MFYIRNLFLLISISALLGLIAGLIKPWIMLWWEDRQNRMKVIKLYGAISATAYAVYVVLEFI